MKKLKVLILSTNADLAGAPLHVKEVSLSLIRDGHEVVVIFGSNGLIEESLQASGINTYVVHGMRSAINPLADIRVYFALRKIIKSERPDLIHCHSAKAGMLGRIVGYKLNIPCIYTVHGWGFGVGRKLIIGFILKTIELLLKKITSHFIAVSESDRKIGIDCLGISSDKISTIRNGVSYIISGSNLRPVEAKVIMVARNDFQKDYLTLARALAKSEVKKAVFVGLGTDSTQFKNEVSRIVDGACSIEFCGLRTDIPELLESSSIFVLSSRYEALPLSIIEAMSKGLPIVASDVGGVNELVLHNQNGFLFKAGDSGALAVYLKTLSGDVDLRRQMGAESIRRYKSEFSADRMMEQTYNVYKKVIGVILR